MSLNIIDIPILSPLKFTLQNYSNPAAYNWRYDDDWKFEDTILDFQQRIDFAQPWQKNETIYLPFLANFAPHNLTMVTCGGHVVASITPAYIMSSIEGTGQKFYVATIPLSGYDEGIYQFILRSGTNDLIIQESEFINLKEKHDTTVQIMCTHNENDFDTVFETGLQLFYRIYGGFKDFTPKSDRQVFIDQSRNAMQLSGRTYYTEKLIIGDSFGVPNWVVKRVNQMLQCSTFIIDGVQWVADEGAILEATREEGYPMAGWGIELRPADFKTRKRQQAEGNLDNPLSIVYNIESDGFGPITGTASGNPIKIQSLD